MNKANLSYKKILIFMFMIILLVGTISAMDWDNVRDYDSKTQTMTIDNAFGLGSRIAEVELNTPMVNNVGLGYQKVFEFTINSYGDYENALKQIEYFNAKDMSEREVQLDLRYKEIYLKNKTYEECSVDNKLNKTICIEKTREVEKIRWNDYVSKDMFEGEITLAGFTDVKKGDYVEFIPTWFGERMYEFASWNASLDVGLMAYYSFDVTGDNATFVQDVIGDRDLNSSGNPVINSSGIIGNAYELDGDDYATGNINIGTEFSTDEMTICYWVNPSTVTDGSHEGLTVGMDDPESGADYRSKWETGSNEWIVQVLDNVAEYVYEEFEAVLAPHNWYFVCHRWFDDSNYIQVSLNGTNLTDTGGGSTGWGNPKITGMSGNLNIHLGAEHGGISPMIGLIDEVSIHNRTLTDDEITEMYDGGVGMTYTPPESTPPSITLNSPIDYFNTSSTSVFFNWTVTDDNNVTNSTFYLSNGSIIEYPHGTSNSTTEELTLKGFSEGTYTWNITSYDNASQLTESSQRTFTINFSLNEINLTAPSNDTETNNATIYFNSSIDPYDVNITNSTIKVFYSNSSLFKSNSTTINNGSITNVSLALGDWVGGTYHWNNYVCFENNATGDFEYCSSSENYTLSWIPFRVDAEYEEDPVFETSSQTFKLNITTEDGYTVQSAKIIYNGTTYSGASRTEIDSDSEELSKTFFIPPGVNEGFVNETRDFYWNVSITNENSGVTNSYVSDTYNQTVSELPFKLCGDGFDVPVLNFTLKDEITDTNINATSNATTFQGTFNYGIDSANIIKNYSINNLTTNSNTFDFCTANYSEDFFIDAEIFYTALDYVDSDYYLNNASIDNETNEITLYLLPSSEALEFFISVTLNLEDLTDATINIAKWFVGEGAYKTVEIDETDDEGEITAYLDLDKKYRFTISKDGEVLGIQEKDATCEAAPCEILLELTSSGDNVFETLNNSFAQNVAHNLSFDSGTKVVTWDFIDTTGLANYFRMYVYRSYSNQSSTLIYDKILYTSSGTITYNASNYSTGDFKVDVYVSRSPEKLIDFITFVLNATAEELGVIGLLTGFLFIMVIIFGLAFKPSVLVLAVPFGLSTIKLMGLVSLSSTSLVVIWLLAVIAIWIMNK